MAMTMTGAGTPSLNVKVKLQSHLAPGGTFKLEASDLKDEEGKLCFSKLQDSVLSLAAGEQGDLSVLYLSLSYLDTDGDLIPLTSQEQWQIAVKHHTSKNTTTRTSKLTQ